ncbi:putative copper-binding protein [Hartmannibacter diazotrophicus]|uniref:Putative copper-binding protein n=1 Tax=Hartmannibacter diazotrophicus TaxID=1482074 RepID=A0A2C9D090_9HYPH|nr:cupredoxin domain-containing protein [Hartmannibacter diazotrophicus]SON53666.1 putative copper-binding protein [Hartmannibacter diazotrophicus]
MMSGRNTVIAAALGMLFAAPVTVALAGDKQPAAGDLTLRNEFNAIEVTLKDHTFSPAEIVVPAGETFEIMLTNADKTPDEFDSKDLHVEKVVAGGNQALIRIRPLKAGTYRFMGEFHSSTAKGVVVAKPAS